MPTDTTIDALEVPVSEEINTEFIQSAQTQLDNINVLADELLQTNDQFIVEINRLLEESKKYSAEIGTYSQPKQ